MIGGIKYLIRKRKRERLGGRQLEGVGQEEKKKAKEEGEKGKCREA